MDKNKCLEMIQNILNSVFNGYYETRILRQDIKEEEWAHAIHTAKRMPLTTLFEEQKRDELVKCFEYMKSGAVPAEPGLQSGFVQPVEGVEVSEGETTAASIEVSVEETVTEPATEEVASETVEETAETGEIAEETVAETETATEPETETAAEPTAEEPTAEEPVAEPAIAELPTAEATVEPDPVETIVEASEPATEEETPTEETKSRRRKK